jgi:hypothetical protein
VPYKEKPPGVSVTETAGRLRIDWGGTVDELGPGHWSRSPGAG